MARYALTTEGMARFRRRKTSVSAEMARMEGYEVLDYLYEQGAGTVEEIGNYTGLSQVQVINKLAVFINHGLAEELP